LKISKKSMFYCILVNNFVDFTPSHLMCASTRTPTVASSLKLKQLWCNETQPTQHQRVSDLNMTEKRHLHLWK
jgi:hypothetical protein